MLLLLIVGGGVFIYLKWQEKQKVVVKEESVEEVVKNMYDMQDPKEKRRYEQLMRAWYWNGEIDEEE